MRHLVVGLFVLLLLGCAEDGALPAPCGRTDCVVCETGTQPCKGQCLSDDALSDACPFVEGGPWVYGRTEGVCGAWEVDACPDGPEGVYLAGPRNAEGGFEGVGVPKCVNADEITFGSDTNRGVVSWYRCVWRCAQYKGVPRQRVEILFEKDVNTVVGPDRVNESVREGQCD